MRDERAKSRDAEAREYLKRARSAADAYNEWIDSWDGPPDSDALHRLATMNALVAIALTVVPAEPGSRLA